MSLYDDHDFQACDNNGEPATLTIRKHYKESSTLPGPKKRLYTTWESFVSGQDANYLDGTRFQGLNDDKIYTVTDSDFLGFLKELG